MGSPIQKETVYDVAIIGTGNAIILQYLTIVWLTELIGLYGIQAARYSLDIHPEANVVLLESDTEIGGTWSRSRSFCLLTNLPNFLREQFVLRTDLL